MVQNYLLPPPPTSPLSKRLLCPSNQCAVAPWSGVVLGLRIDESWRRRHQFESSFRSTPFQSHNSRPHSDRTDAPHPIARPCRRPCVRDSQYMDTIKCPRNFTLVCPCSLELPQIDVYHVNQLDICYRLPVERCALLVS